MNLNEIFQGAPRYLTKRYYALNSYVWESLFPEDYRKKLSSKLKTPIEKKEKYKKMKLISDEATILVFIFVVKDFLSNGSRMAKDTVDILNEFDIPGFNLGNSYFSRRNENVILGDKLANKLISLIDDDARSLIENSTYISQILEKYKRIEI